MANITTCNYPGCKSGFIKGVDGEAEYCPNCAGQKFCQRYVECKFCHGTEKLRFGIGSFDGTPETCHLCTNGFKCAGGEPVACEKCPGDGAEYARGDGVKRDCACGGLGWGCSNCGLPIKPLEAK